MTAEEFARLASQGYNRIPLVREVLADLETPLGVYLKLAQGPYSYFLESMQGGETWGRYSFTGLPCRTVLKVAGSSLQVIDDGVVCESCTSENPFEFIAAFQARYRIPELEQ